MKLLFSTLIFAAISCITWGQEAARMPGQVLVMTKQGADIQKIVDATNLEIGILPQLKVDLLVSEPMRTWQLSFDESALDMREMLFVLSKNLDIQFAQVNHIIEDRVVPNDPFFGQQWYHQNAGDHDIDSELAWDITTGGLTATGDEIVVCVVETSGAKWDQADIVANHWINSLEIPDNGIDDDGNGYIDDVDGWNVSSNTDNIGTGNHGTQVSSMIGAKGNNSAGIAGVNWDVKIMQVHMGGISESNVVAAYSYPFVMRKKYNQTGGAEGAFVVATNSSWGTDFGQPANAPIWCAMYDSLGTYGVLSCGATSNSALNIDAVGDLPTACPSEFMVAVTATDNNDVRTFSGYGQTTIDLGAPGDNVFLAGNNNYGNTSGTSFASPCVAGAIALLYSVPCTNIMAISYADPALGAAMIRDYIFDGTDAVANLTTETVTGGRLNINNSIQMMLENCSNDDCFAPFSVMANVVEGTLNINFSWASTPAMSSFNFQYRINQGDWILIENLTTNQFTLEGVTPCAEVEYQVGAVCNGNEGPWTDAMFVTSEGCCINPSTVTIADQTDQSVLISWNDVYAADGFTLVLVNQNGTETVFDAPENSLLIEGLEACTNYNVQVFSNCVSPLEPATSYPFSTFGCGSCLDLTYCEINGNSSLEWIENVTLETINNSTDSDNGYGDYRNIGTSLVTGGTYEISATPGYSGTNYNEYFRAWIDFNQNGIFENTEKVMDSNGTTTSTFSQEFSVPENALGGTAVLRVAMAYVGAFGGNPPSDCGDLDYGEAEDYCITINTTISVESLETNTLALFPNPASNTINWQGTGEIQRLEIFNSNGQKVMDRTTIGSNTLSIAELANGIYFVRATNNANDVFTQQMSIVK